jgi:ABC-type antimicrobial peptide transport system permease subunit
MEAFAVLATAMAVFGVYGLLSYVVQQRRKEVGIRLALSATRAAIAMLLIRSGAVLGAAGIATGLLLAGLTTRGLSPLLYGVNADDPVTFAAVPVIVLLLALGATVGPALSAARTNPATMLHEE